MLLTLDDSNERKRWSMKVKTMKNRWIGSRLLSILMAVILCFGMVPISGYGVSASANSRTLKLAVLSDMHYVAPGQVPAEGTRPVPTLTMRCNVNSVLAVRLTVL